MVFLRAIEQLVLCLRKSKQPWCWRSHTSGMTKQTPPYSWIGIGISRSDTNKNEVCAENVRCSKIAIPWVIHHVFVTHMYDMYGPSAFQTLHVSRKVLVRPSCERGTKKKHPAEESSARSKRVPEPKACGRGSFRSREDEPITPTLINCHSICLHLYSRFPIAKSWCVSSLQLDIISSHPG